MLRCNYVHITSRIVVTIVLIAGVCLTAEAKKHPKTSSAKDKGSPAEREAATRLQVFLDRANFGPGKIDGHYGEFTRQALALYRQSRGEQVAPQDLKNTSKAPNVEGLDLTSVEPVFTTYTVSDADLQNVGELPNDVAAKAKLKRLPYRDAAEAVAEKFHSDPKFLEQLNPGKMKGLKAGDQVMVPSVEPFELAAVKDLKPGSEMASAPANDIADDSDNSAQEKAVPDADSKTQSAADKGISIRVDGHTKMLGVYEGGAVVAAYPVTIGSAETKSPVGNWKVRGIAKMPTFRYDKKMLQKGQRSSDFKMLPPGPNNPVGVIWIALNKKGIGLHGTDDPDSIGRVASHGCVRLANWDIVRLAAKVKNGVDVSIQ